MAPKLSIGIVNFNSGYRLAQCLEALARHAPTCEHEILVIDNASTDGSADFLRKSPPPERVRFFDDGVNYTLTGGQNYLFARARGDLYLIMNADLVAGPGSLDALVARLESDPSLGAVGGWHVKPDGTDELYVNRFPTVRAVYLTRFARPERAKRSEAYRRYHYLDRDVSSGGIVDQPAGGCFLLRRELLAGRLMSPDFGVLWSDVEVAKRIQLLGRRIALHPDARFVHDHDRRPKPLTPTSALVDLDYYVGAMVYFRRYVGIGAWLALKAAFAARLAGTLLLVEIPRAMRGIEPWPLARARARSLLAFLVERNLLLEKQKRAAAAKGLAWP